MYSRFDSATPRDTHMYPAQKKGQTTKERRYRPLVKKSDQDKIHGKLKGRSHRKIKSDGIPLNIEDIVNPEN
ncbi:MAG: hypothetical protein IJ777_03710 [Clostridia bacterium]|nr:hypothetical protein [Clostridia bacterium]